VNSEQAAHADAAMTRSGAWMAAGSPAHGYETGPGGWCARCGCGPDGQQHQAEAAPAAEAEAEPEPGRPAEATAAAARMITFIQEHAWMGEWGDLLADNPELRSFDAIADVHWFDLWQAAGYEEPPRDRALLAAVEAEVDARLAALAADDLRTDPEAGSILALFPDRAGGLDLS
jgi:hypothetical protein